MKFYQTNDKFTVEQTPTGVWAVSGFLIFLALLMLYGLLGGASNSSKIPFLYVVLGSLFCLAFIIASLVFASRNPKLKTTFDRTLQKILVQKIHLFGKHSEEYSFSDISSIITDQRTYLQDPHNIKIRNMDGSAREVDKSKLPANAQTRTGYDIALVLKSNKKVYLTASYEDKKRAIYDLVTERLNEFVGR